MTANTLNPKPAAAEGECQPPDLQRGACLEFVQFCKEQHLNSRAAHTFLHVLHNQTWEKECEKIRESMRPEVDRIFAPIEKALQDGANCREVLALLVDRLNKAEYLK
jgi:hypothetical protein